MVLHNSDRADDALDEELQLTASNDKDWWGGDGEEGGLQGDGELELQVLVRDGIDNEVGDIGDVNGNVEDGGIGCVNVTRASRARI